MPYAVARIGAHSLALLGKKPVPVVTMDLRTNESP